MSDGSSPTVSARKIRANRLNAQKSTGPRTEEGKRISSRNSLLHGLYCAKDFILPGESQAQFLMLRQNHIRSFLPMNSIELSLVERIARNEWKIARVHQLQRQWHLLQMKKEQLQAEVLASSVAHPGAFLTEEDSDSMTQFDRDYLEHVFEARGGEPEFRDPRKAREKMLVESIGRGMVTQEDIRSVQFAGDERALDRFERLEKMELRYENAMDKAMRQLERLQMGRRKRLGPDEIDQDEFTCPYLEEYREIQEVMEQERDEEREYLEEIGANEATEGDIDGKSNGGKDLAMDGAGMDTDKEENEEVEKEGDGDSDAAGTG